MHKCFRNLKSLCWKMNNPLDSFFENVKQSEIESSKQRKLLRELEDETQQVTAEIESVKENCIGVENDIKEKEHEVIKAAISLKSVLQKKAILTDLLSSAKKKMEEEKENLEAMQDKLLLKREKFCNTVREHMNRYGILASVKGIIVESEEKENELIIDDAETNELEKDVAELKAALEQVERDLLSDEERLKDAQSENKRLVSEPSEGDDFIILRSRLKQWQDKTEVLECKCRELENAIVNMDTTVGRNNMNVVIHGKGKNLMADNKIVAPGREEIESSALYTLRNSGKIPFQATTSSKKRVSFYCYEEDVSDIPHPYTDPKDIPVVKGQEQYSENGQISHKDSSVSYTTVKQLLNPVIHVGHDAPMPAQQHSHNQSWSTHHENPTYLKKSESTISPWSHNVVQKSGLTEGILQRSSTQQMEQEFKQPKFKNLSASAAELYEGDEDCVMETFDKGYGIPSPFTAEDRQVGNGLTSQFVRKKFVPKKPSSISIMIKSRQAKSPKF